MNENRSLREKNPIRDSSSSNQMPKTDQENSDCSLRAQLFISELPSNISTFTYYFFSYSHSWYLYHMVAQNMLRTCEVK